jgi:hypothetical protein
VGLESDLAARLAALGHTLAAREAKHADASSRARALAEALHARVAAALAAYHDATRAAPQLAVLQGAVRLDDKHLHAFEFDVRRGRHRVIVVVKSRGDVTLVGPFHMGKDEGPCRRIAFEPSDVESPGEALNQALGDVLEAFLEEAATP